MNKPVKPPRKDAKKQAIQAVDSAQPVKETATGKPLRRAGEGPDNLRQRAEWFRSRAGSGK
jgi:hypothetical protein